jgi:hypothetical protein
MHKQLKALEEELSRLGNLLALTEEGGALLREPPLFTDVVLVRRQASYMPKAVRAFIDLARQTGFGRVRIHRQRRLPHGRGSASGSEPRA